MAGTLSLTVVYSLDFCRTKLAADAKGKGGERQYKGLLDVYKQTIVSYAFLKLIFRLHNYCVTILIKCS